MNKKPFSSKKFIAFFFSMLVLASIAMVALFTQEFNWAMSAFMSILCAAIGGLGIGYVLSQKALDKFLGAVSTMKDTDNVSKDC